jgi:RNA polymerase sigma-70 factor (ECF subfamily)
VWDGIFRDRAGFARPLRDVTRGGGASALVEPVSAADRRDSDARVRALFEAYFDFVWRSLRRLGVPESSLRDASQQVFIVVGRRIDGIEQGNERTFLFGTAMRVAADTRRSMRRSKESPSHDGEIDAIALEAERPEELLDRKRARETLDRVLDTLPEELRAVFVLFELEELPTKEVADLLGIPVGTAASRLRRAREEFAATVKRMNARGAR